MACHEGISTNKSPWFNGSNYALWSVRMMKYLVAQEFDIWQAVVTGYKIPSTPRIYGVEKKLGDHNTKTMNVIFFGLSKSKFFKVMYCKSEK